MKSYSNINLLVKSITIIAILSIAILFGLNSQAKAVSASDWQAGRIIDDSTFTNQDMSVADIQNFLNSKVPTCDTWGTLPAREYGRSDITHAQYAALVGWPGPPYVCLKNFHEVPKVNPGPGIPANSFDNGGNPPAGSISAAQMIYNASARHNTSPKVLLVKLATESLGPLTSDTWPLRKQYTYAMGAHVPDSGPGGTPNPNTNYAGFSIQIEESARLLRYYMDNMQKDWWTNKKPYQNNNILWNVEASGCGSSPVFMQNIATTALYVYTPYQPNAAALANMYGTGDRCSAYGNRNFWTTFNNWFGNSIGGQPRYKAYTVNNSEIYVVIDNYKYIVPYAAAMQDYGISWDSIQKVSQQYLDSIPTSTQNPGVSPAISHVIKSVSDADADGGSVYVVSVGKRYQVQSMQQFFDYGFKESEISYLPLSAIIKMNSGGMLSNFVKSPNGSVFGLSESRKKLIFEYSTYKRLNPSDNITNLSYYLIDKIPSSAPIVDRPVLIKYSTGESLTYYYQNTYANIPTYEQYVCSGFETTNQTPVYRIPQNNYIDNVAANEDLSCNVSSDNISYMLNYGVKSPVPITILPSFDNAGTLQKQILSKVPTANHQLSNYVKLPNNDAVWHIQSSKKRVIPTYNTYKMIGLSNINLDFLQESNLKLFEYDGFQLAYGQVIKDTSSAAVYVASANGRYGFPTSDLFLAYKNDWSKIDTLDAWTLNKNYPVSNNIEPIIINKDNQAMYAIGNNGCFQLDSNLISSIGLSKEKIQESQNFNNDIFRNINFNECKKGTYFIKSSNSSVVYWVNKGTKLPLLTYNDLLNKNSGIEPIVMSLETSFVDTIPTNK